MQTDQKHMPVRKRSYKRIRVINLQGICKVNKHIFFKMFDAKVINRDTIILKEKQNILKYYIFDLAIQPKAILEIKIYPTKN